MRNPNGPPPKGGKAKPASKPKSTAKAPAKRKKRDIDDDDEAEAEDDEDSKPPPSKRGRAAKPKSKGKVKADDAEEDDLEEADEDEETVGSGGKVVPELLLANKWDVESGPDPTGWWVSEKLDGVRCVMRFQLQMSSCRISTSYSTFYDGKQFLSRLGNPFTPPVWFLESATKTSFHRGFDSSVLLAELPKDITLDGELYGGRGEFQSTVSIVKTVNSIHWKNISFQVSEILSFLQRLID